MKEVGASAASEASEELTEMSPREGDRCELVSRRICWCWSNRSGLATDETYSGVEASAASSAI